MNKKIIKKNNFEVYNKNKMSDTFIYEDSNEVQSISEPFVSRQVVYVLDQSSGGNYSGSQILLDTTSLSNSGKYVSYQEAYFQIPLVLRLSATSANAQVAGVRNLESSFALGLKSGFFHLFHSFSVEMNNQTIVQQTPFSNHYINFKLLTSLSQESLKKYATILGFYPDSYKSVQYGSQTIADGAGHGSINNRNLPAWTADVYDYQTVLSTFANDGYYQRQVNNTAFNPTALSVSGFTSASQVGAVGLSYFRRGTGPDIDSKWWFALATIRLKDIHSVFAQMPLSRGTYLRFIINLNQASHNISLTVANPPTTITDVSITSSTLANGTSPLLVAKANQAGNGFYPIAQACLAAGGPGTYTFQAALSVGKDQTYNISNPTLSQVRLYAPLYQFAPTYEESYLTLNKVKRVVYSDIYQYSVNVSCSGSVGNFQGNFNSLISNGLVAPKSIIIIPYIGSASNAIATGGANPVSPYQSPFASEPATTSPYLTLTNMQVLVAGINVFLTQEQYTFQNFLDEFKSANAINGSNLDGLDSGLVSFDQYAANMTYFYADISRRLPAEQVVPKSIQIQGTVQSGTVANVELMIFVEVEKEFTIDLCTGQKLS